MEDTSDAVLIVEVIPVPLLFIFPPITREDMPTESTTFLNVSVKIVFTCAANPPHIIANIPKRIDFFISFHA